MEPGFGEYITKEYGLLKQILSYLKPSDLLNAQLVCRDWESAVDSLVEKNPITLTYSQDQDNTKPFISKPIFPALVIHQYIPSAHSQNPPKTCSLCKQPFFICPCTVSSPDTLFVSLDPQCHHSAHPPGEASSSSYTFWQTYSALIMPSSPEIQVSTYFLEEKSNIFKKQITDEIVTLCTGSPEPIKCLLVIKRVSTRASKNKWLNQLIHQIIDRQGLTFAVGGGDIRGIICKRGLSFIKEKWIKRPTMVLVSIRGDHVTAHSDILTGFDSYKIEDFMSQLSSRVGPLPNDCSRMAFIAQCVARTDETVEGYESNAFNKAFPSVTQFGFRAYGEFGISSSSSGDQEPIDSSKKMKMTFTHAQTTSFLILTFKKI